MRILFLLLALAAWVTGFPQRCPNPGQNPATAFPVCGTSVFEQHTVPLCQGTLLPSPQCRADAVSDVNPYWYKFTCFQSGTLGFLITPKSLSDDYDWELYDVTGKNPNDIYTDGSLVVSNNWSGEPGLTGASSAGNARFVCGGLGKALFSSMPALTVGHNYLLLISHFTETQTGYSLEFKGGTAVITDPTPPGLKKAEANCGGDKIRVSLNKKMKCNSVAADGSDFLVTPGNIRVIKAVGLNCSAGFDTDSLELTLEQPLPVGNYSLVAKMGTDGNTILDNCGADIPVNTATGFAILPQAPTPMDSLAPLLCAPGQLRLIFSKPIQCSSIAPNGSDFTISGAYPVTITRAEGICSNGLTREIIIQLNKPLEAAGIFSVILRRGVDGNTLRDECNEETPVGSSLDFVVKDTVNAGFSFTVQYGCEVDLVDYVHPGGNGIDSWQWDLADNFRATAQNPQAAYRIFRDKAVQLIVSNGFCSDTSSQTILLENYLQADFDVAEDNCPQEPIAFTDRSEGKIVSYSWDFGGGSRAIDPSPRHIYPRPERVAEKLIRLAVTDQWGCIRVREKTIRIYPSCIIDLPNAFTPNSDNVNEWFYPLNAVKAEQLQFNIYNRWGQLMYHTDNWKKGWDGNYLNTPQPAGMYIWTLSYVNRDTKKLIQRKGTVMLIR